MRVTLARGMRQSSRTVDSHGADPSTAAVSGDRKSTGLEDGPRSQAVRRRDLFHRPTRRSSRSIRPYLFRESNLFLWEEAQLRGGLAAMLLLSAPARRQLNPAWRVPGRSFQELEVCSAAVRVPQ